jgi:hypothetical protein
LPARVVHAVGVVYLPRAPRGYNRIVKLGFRVSDRALQVVVTLREVLGARVRLFDAERGRVHAHLRKDDWVSSSRPTPPPLRKDGCVLLKPINQTWSLHIARRGAFDPSAERLLAWAALQLVNELPAAPPGRPLSFEPPISPARGGGGSSGAAELGVPLSWARRNRR